MNITMVNSPFPGKAILYCKSPISRILAKTTLKVKKTALTQVGAGLKELI